MGLRYQCSISLEYSNSQQAIFLKEIWVSRWLSKPIYSLPYFCFTSTGMLLKFQEEKKAVKASCLNSSRGGLMTPNIQKFGNVSSSVVDTCKRLFYWFCSFNVWPILSLSGTSAIWSFSSFILPTKTFIERQANSLSSLWVSSS